MSDTARPGGRNQPPEGLLPGPVETTRVFDGEVLRVRVSHYARPDGERVKREVIDHYGAIAIVAIEDEHILMVRQPREAVGEITLELPAGKLDGPGEDPFAAAQRELAEEVGRKAAQWDYLGGFYTAPAIITEFIHLFVATDLTPHTLQADEDEQIEVVRLPFSAIPGAIERCRDAKTLVGLLRVARVLGV